MFSPAGIMLIPLMGIALLVPVFAVVLLLRARRPDTAKGCEACGYPRRGLDTAHCPECGTPWNDRSRVSVPDRSATNLMVVVVLAGVPLVFLLWTLFEAFWKR